MPLRNKPKSRIARRSGRFVGTDELIRRIACNFGLTLSATNILTRLVIRELIMRFQMGKCFRIVGLGRLVFRRSKEKRIWRGRTERTSKERLLPTRRYTVWNVTREKTEWPPIEVPRKSLMSEEQVMDQIQRTRHMKFREIPFNSRGRRREEANNIRFEKDCSTSKSD